MHMMWMLAPFTKVLGSPNWLAAGRTCKLASLTCGLPKIRERREKENMKKHGKIKRGATLQLGARDLGHGLNCDFAQTAAAPSPSSPFSRKANPFSFRDPQLSASRSPPPLRMPLQM